MELRLVLPLAVEYLELVWVRKKKHTWFENDGRAERPGLKGLAVPALSSNCLPLIKSPWHIGGS